MALGYERVVVSLGEAQDALGPGHSLPAIKNGERIASGKAHGHPILGDFEENLASLTGLGVETKIEA